MKPLVLMALLLSACATPTPKEEPVGSNDTTPAAETPEARFLAEGREATRLFYAGEAAALHARFSEEMVAALPAEQWAAVQAQTAEGLGRELTVVDESVSRLLDNHMYYRTVTFEKVPGAQLTVTWGFRDDGTISGFNIRPKQEPAATPHLDYQTKTALRVPFDGEWTVIWGGRSVEQNYHAATVSQRFALDLVVTDASHRSFSGDRAKNESYYAFGRPVFAPGAGKVIARVNDVPDNVPGQMNPAQLAGNYVLIDHQNGEYSLLAHFKQGSVTVNVGDDVAAGQQLGLCGNSGNSSEPHIHYHLQNVPEPLGGEALPIQFEAAVVDGTRHERVEILQGQRVTPP